MRLLTLSGLVLAGLSACNDDGGNGDGNGARAVCGNGILEASEACEGFDVRGATCAAEGFSAGAIGCTDNCILDTSACTSCGDGNVETNEACEPDNLMGESCASILGAGQVGDLACNPTCTGFVTTSCRREIPAQDLESCNKSSANPCADTALDCVTTAQGDFCLESCDPLSSVGPCGAGRFCYDLGGQGLCLDVPGRGEICSTDSGCDDPGDDCVPSFAGDGGAVALCLQRCAPNAIATPLSGCDADSVCTSPPNATYELESDATCVDITDCDRVGGFDCLDLEIDGKTVKRCAQPYAVCGARIPFFPFDGSAPDETLSCDRSSPTGGARFCAAGDDLDGNGFASLARVECYPLISASPDIGVCIGFCDQAVLGSTSDGFCGDQNRCTVPPEPEFYLTANEQTPLLCDNDPNICITTGYPDCLDVGRGRECVRPARVCVELVL